MIKEVRCIATAARLGVAATAGSAVENTKSFSPGSLGCELVSAAAK